MIHETTKGMQIIIPLKTLISKVFHNYNNFTQTFYKNNHKIQFNNTVTVINNHSLGSILTFTLLDLVKQTKVTNTVYAIETKKISVCRYDLFM